jgi:exodeoxyribonuclease-3
MKRIVSWNIQHGGGKRLRQVCEVLSTFNADVLVVSEFRANPGGQQLKDHLARSGYQLSHPKIDPKLNTVLVASRSPIRSAGPLLGRQELGRRQWCVDFDDLRLCAVYMPLGQDKLLFWQALVEVAVNANAPQLVIGDFNTGNNQIDLSPGATPFALPEYMDRMAGAGYVDVWRHGHGEDREYTWYCKRRTGGWNGFRLDHAFLRQPLARVKHCEFDHRPRVAGVSDHSALILEVEFA